MGTDPCAIASVGGDEPEVVSRPGGLVEHGRRLAPTVGLSHDYL